MKFKFIGKKKLDIGGVGIVEPEQVFDVNNEALLPIFKIKHLFEPLNDKNVTKKVIKKEE
jgi:uncharacterized protein YfkK (UPF0435 family)